MMLLTRLIVYVTLALVLVFKGGWKGVVAAVVMAADRHDFRMVPVPPGLRLGRDKRPQ